MTASGNVKWFVKTIEIMLTSPIVRSIHGHLLWKIAANSNGETCGHRFVNIHSPSILLIYVNIISIKHFSLVGQIVLGWMWRRYQNQATCLRASIPENRKTTTEEGSTSWQALLPAYESASVHTKNKGLHEATVPTGQMGYWTMVKSKHPQFHHEFP